MSQWDFSGPPPAWRRGEYDEYGEFVPSDDPEPGAIGDDFDGGEFSPISYERDPYPQDTAGWPYDRPAYTEPPPYTTVLGTPGAPGAPGASGQTAARSRRALPDESWPPRVPPRRGRPRWLIAGAVAAAVAAAAGASMMLVAGSHPAGTSGTSGAPGASGQAAGGGRGAGAPSAPSVSAPPGAGARQPVTMARAAQILAGYTTANNKANAAMSEDLLATVESGSSLAIDAGIYRVQRAQKQGPYPAFGPERTRIYIPSQPAGTYPHWFVAQVVNADLATPGKPSGTQYVLFTQSAPGAPWRNTIEPYVVGDRATPAVATGAGGLAIPVSAGQSTLAVPPSSIASVTAASLDGAPAAPANPGNLADRLDQQFWHQRLPTATVLDRHAAASGPVFGLRTTDGGALLFYTDKATLTLIPPAGEILHLTIPGFFSPSQGLNKAAIGYMEQFATYVPPLGGSGLRVVADYSGITSG